MGRRNTLEIEPLYPGAALLAKIGSIVVHVDEGLGRGGHEFDIAAIKALVNDREVQQWIDAMEKLALVPKKR